MVAETLELLACPSVSTNRSAKFPDENGKSCLTAWWVGVLLKSRENDHQSDDENG